jgi:Leucine-rich repeat (LRR) protein
MIATALDQALDHGQRSGVLKLSGCSLDNLDVLWNKKNKKSQNINYSFDSNELRWWETAAYVKVDLSDNLLSQLDDRLSEWEHVKTIDLRKNSFTDFPKIFTLLPALTKLNISKNKLDRINSDLIHVLDLDASFNRIVCVSASIPNLRKLDLSHNQLTHVPGCIQECRCLTVLNLSHNVISDATNSLDDLKSLCDLDISHNNLRQVFNKHTILPNLARLVLNHNALAHIPEGKFIMLTDLTASYNNISDGSNEDILKGSVDLQVLDLSDNNLSRLPESIFHMKLLKRLDFSNNSIPFLPPELGLLSNLQTINHFGNPAKVPNGFRTEKILKWLRNKLPVEKQMAECKIHIQDTINVDLSNSKINIITSEMVRNMPRSLKLSNNLISSLDIVFDFANNLSILELSRNRIKEFPIKSLPVLQV